MQACLSVVTNNPASVGSWESTLWPTILTSRRCTLTFDTDSKSSGRLHLISCEVLCIQLVFNLIAKEIGRRISALYRYVLHDWMMEYVLLLGHALEHKNDT